jgi:hypothetical protein
MVPTAWTRGKYGSISPNCSSIHHWFLLPGQEGDMALSAQISPQFTPVCKHPFHKHRFCPRQQQPCHQKRYSRPIRPTPSPTLSTPHQSNFIKYVSIDTQHVPRNQYFDFSSPTSRNSHCLYTIKATTEAAYMSPTMPANTTLLHAGLQAPTKV